MAAVRIGVQRQGDWLGFDLGEVMAAVGPQQHLDWFLSGDVWFIGDVSQVWSPEVAVEAEAAEWPGLAVDWPTMEKLAATGVQTVDGCFTGFRGSRPELQLLAVDSSYWIVWARDDAILRRVERAFVNVESYSEPEPASLP